MKVHELKGGGGVRLHVREWGEETAPSILFIHGWSQSHLCWQRQYESELADAFRLVALDLRGHGMSQAPLEPDHYTQPRLWADDIAAVIEQLDLHRPVLVGWSYGGFIVGDYLRAYGTAEIAGINFVGAVVTLNKEALGTLIGPGFVDNVVGATSDDLPTNIEAIRRFLRANTSTPLPADLFETALGWNMAVPAKVRAALVAREIDSDDVLAALTVPVLVSHGHKDQIILPAMGEHIVATCPRAVPSWYPDIGHMTFVEEADRFNSELMQFAQDAQERQP
ncbi:alpha/beta hydrolase [Chelativorans sp. M5D2P16]|uniref:alpha/beta fold hydrolase n=1 Tax=Chelativorans sp. M5D2P16 TaxID=3095678 RepID=UPI002ACADC73|nr:alpha/beta hydrolase [Chelativorans sp. M5D2P16]MDZ5698626.1 alpha/beta hydrolase [Chelativorans sp. M5D2P16]